MSIVTGIVLKVLRYSDVYKVATLYTRESGRLTVLIREHRARGAAALQPLSVIEGSMALRNGASMGKLSRYAPVEVHTHIVTDVRKSTIALFLAEFLDRLLRESAPDQQIWYYVTGALQLLDRESSPGRLANFHLVFLADMASLVGVQPDLSGVGAGQWFDFRTGAYGIRPTHADALSPELGYIPVLLSRLNFYNSHKLRLSGLDRYRLVCGILRYYAMRFPEVGSMKSHHILRDIFS